MLVVGFPLTTDNQQHVRILFIGDIVGKPGREIVERAVAGLVREEQLDLVVANAENAAGGSGRRDDSQWM